MRRVFRVAVDEGAMSAELEILLPETLEAVPCNLCGSWDAQEIYPAAERRNGHGPDGGAATGHRPHDRVSARYSWITTGVPTVANCQNQAASAGAIPMQPWLPGIPNVAGRRQ